MAKIFSILTIVVAAAAIYFGLEADKRATELGAAGKKLKGTLDRTETQLKKTEADLATTQTKLADTEKELAATKETLRTTEVKLQKAETDLAAANKELTDAKSALAEISNVLKELFPDKQIDPTKLKETIAEMKTTVTELATAKKELTEKVSSLEKENATLASQVSSLEDQNKNQGSKITVQEKTINKYKDNIMEKGIRGRVLAVNHGWGFCVLSVGDKAGAAANKVMVVARGGQAIGRVKITNVEANQSVADILTGSFVRGLSVEPGDTVIYTGDDKVKIEPEATPVTPAPAAAPSTTALPELPQR